MTTGTPAKSLSKRQALLLLAAMVAVVFGPAVRYAFLYWDDITLVVENGLLRLDGESLRRIWTGPVYGLYTPLAYTLWALLTAVAGKSPAAFHLLNVGLHLTAAGLTFQLLTRRTGSQLAGFFGAAFWAIHPMQIEAVTWVSGMNNLLAGVFSLAAALAWPKADEPGKFWTRYAVATLLFALALFSKPTALVTPFLVIGFWGLRPYRRMLPALAGWIPIALAFILAGANAQPAADTPELSLPAKTVVATDALGFYAAKTVFPYPLTIDHGRRPTEVIDGMWKDGYVIPGAAVVLGACILIAMYRRDPTGPWIGLAGSVVFVFITALLPILGFKRFDFQQQVSTVAERYAYLALLGPAMLTGMLATRPRTRPVVVAVLVAFGGLAIQARTHWSDTDTMFAHVRATRPNSALAPRVLAFLAARENRNDDAETLYLQALALRPDDRTTSFNVGNLYMRLGNYAAALPRFEAAMATGNPNLRAGARTNRAILLELSGHVEEAQGQYRLAMQDDPTYAPAYANLGRSLEQTDPNQARRLYEKSLQLDPALEAAKRGLVRLGL